MFGSGGALDHRTGDLGLLGKAGEALGRAFDDKRLA